MPSNTGVLTTGVPSEILGQSITACLARRIDMKITEREGLRYCPKRPGSFIAPESLECVQGLPNPPNGKDDDKAWRGNNVMETIPKQCSGAL